MTKFKVGDKITYKNIFYEVTAFNAVAYKLRSDAGYSHVSINLIDSLFIYAVVPKTLNQVGIDSILKGSCNHSFQEYFGMTEHYKFCTKCDIKEII